jgi:hypothetical protein
MTGMLEERNDHGIVTRIYKYIFICYECDRDRLCGLVVSVPGYRSRGPGSIPGATRFFSEK